MSEAIPIAFIDNDIYFFSKARWVSLRSTHPTKSAVAALDVRRNRVSFTYQRPLPAANAAVPEGVLEHALRGYATAIGESLFAH
ncbi:MAG: hypothetical protein WAZ48_16650 [Lysobacteraceae bacterium]